MKEQKMKWRDTATVLWKNAKSEKELLEILDIPQSALKELRGKGLPFLEVTDNCRLYIDIDVLTWLKNQSSSYKKNAEPLPFE